MLKISVGWSAAGLLTAVGVAFGQPDAARTANPAFEVASVKPSPPLDVMAVLEGKAHVGTTVDKARVDIGSVSLLGLVCQAFQLKPYQLAGLPDWAATTRFDIAAKLPEGASRNQVPEMLQSLLVERFKLATHHEKKEQSVYALVVAKNGPKLKEAPPGPDETPGADSNLSPASAAGAAAGKEEVVIGVGDQEVRVKPAGKGALSVNITETGPVQVSFDKNGSIHEEFEGMTMHGLAAALSEYLDRPVVDLTEIQGRFQVSLQVPFADTLNAAGRLGIPVPIEAPAANIANLPAGSAPDPSGSSLFTSVQQLGLKLESRKLPYDLLVIDHLEKSPTEN
jgi:uncharacterized protein (TIGR03435 family)